MGYKEARENYKPKPIGVLWIGESPPDAGGYFYFETFTPPGYLFKHTMEALNFVDDTTAFAEGMDKTPLLKRFRDCGHYLVDLSERPVNGKKIKKSERKKMLVERVPEFLAEVARLAPKRVLIIKANVHKILYERLSDTGYSALNREHIPFPSHHWQYDFVLGVRKALEAF